LNLNITIIGVGLIGGSVALAAKQHHLVAEIVGTGRNEAELATAVRLGVIDRYDLNISTAVAGADLVIVAVPLGAIRAVFEQIKGHLRDTAVLTDVGSAKVSVIDDALAVFGDLPPGFVPGHPIAGTEKRGVEAAFAALFDQRNVILTPTKSSQAEAIATVSQFWTRCGANVITMDPQHHDEVLAATSHLPHVLAFTMVNTLSRLHGPTEAFRYAAGGFRDFTRIASSDPVMWRDVCLANAEATLMVLDRYIADLGTVADAIKHGDGDRLKQLFSQAKQIRDDNIK